MKRERRIDGYRGSLEGTERERAARAQIADRQVREACARLGELERYRHEYMLGFGRRIVTGISGPALRDYHAFVDRLEGAIIQQRLVIQRCEAERERDQQRWREIAVQLKAVSAVIERWRVEERTVELRGEQREIDERALHMRHAALAEV